MGIFQQGLHTPVFFQEFFSSFITHSRESGYIIDSISHHSQVVDHLLRAFNLKSSLYFWDSPDFDSVAHSSRAVHEYVFGNQLCKIFVWGYHKGFKTLFFCLFGESSNDIIGLKTCFLNNRYLHSL